MKYKKFVVITLVTTLLCASLSAVATSSDTEPKPVDKNNRIFPRGIFGSWLNNFWEKIRNLLSTLRERFAPDHSTDDEEEPEDPVLELTLELDERYEYDSPINVVARLTNVGEDTIKVVRLSFSLGTLDLFISLPPDGKNKYHYTGKLEGPITERDLIELESGDSITLEVDINNEDMFGPKTDSSSKLPWLLFEPGAYRMYGHYKVHLDNSAEAHTFCGVWEGELDSTWYGFEVYK